MDIFTTKYEMTKEERDQMIKYCKSNGIKLQHFAGVALKEKVKKVTNEKRD